ncbi:MAG: hypothetical protein NC121_07015 [Blautia sp.]|nr:hypothetical protein [Blautia sp.]
MYRVQMVSQVPKTRRENGGSPQRDPNSSKAASFALTLEKALDESRPGEYVF